MRGWGNIFQLKEQDETSEKEPSETGISNLPNKEFKVMVLNMYIELGRWVDKHSESLKHRQKISKNIKQKLLWTEKYSRGVEQQTG